MDNLALIGRYDSNVFGRVLLLLHKALTKLHQYLSFFRVVNRPLMANAFAFKMIGIQK